MRLLLTLITALIISSCGKDNSGEPYLFETELKRVWTSVDGHFGQIDFTDLNSVTIFDMKRDGIPSDCTYKVIQKNHSGFYGTLDFIYISGDSYVCSQMTGEKDYNLYRDSRDGKEHFTLAGHRFE